MTEKITGGLSITEKNALSDLGPVCLRCRVGSLLGQKEGTACHDCYALGGRYGIQKVQDKLEERCRGLSNPLWTPAMIHPIRWYCDEYFRWFDARDLQGENHLRNHRRNSSAPVVLNAFRHQRTDHAEAETGDRFLSVCSTPFGINGRIT